MGVEVEVEVIKEEKEEEEEVVVVGDPVVLRLDKEIVVESAVFEVVDARSEQRRKRLHAPQELAQPPLHKHCLSGARVSPALGIPAPLLTYTLMSALVPSLTAGGCRLTPPQAPRAHAQAQAQAARAPHNATTPNLRSASESPTATASAVRRARSCSAS